MEMFETDTEKVYIKNKRPVKSCLDFNHFKAFKPDFLSFSFNGALKHLLL